MELFIQQVVLVFTSEWGTKEKNVYMDGPKSNENDFFAQRSRARKG
jgi:hypothetical protein